MQGNDMELKNGDILIIFNGMDNIMSIPVKGKMKFKTLKNYKNLAEAKNVIVESLPKEAIGDDGRLHVDEDINLFQDVNEIMEEVQNVDLSTYTIDEMEDLEISPATLQALEKIIEEG